MTRAGADVHLTRKKHDVARQIGCVAMHKQLLAAPWSGDEDARIEYPRIVIRSLIANELGVGYRLLSRSSAPSQAATVERNA